MPTPRKLPPIWLMGLGFLPLGASGALLLATVPILLSSNHVPEHQIAAITSAGLIAGAVSFVASPLLDWRFSRKSYAILFAALGALFVGAALTFIRALAILPALVFAGNFCISLCINAVGGWFGNLTAEDEGKTRLGVWFNIFNVAAGGVVGSTAIYAIRDLPPGVGIALLSLCVAAAIPLYLAIDCPPADSKLAHERFAAFAGDVLTLVRRPVVLWTLLLYIAPAASFAMTNTLPGFGADFHTSEHLVGLIAGVGVALAGVIGSFVILGLASRVPPRTLYLLVGGFGALFSLGMIVAPHTALTFGLGVLGENIFQAAAFSTQNIVTLRTIGRDNPLASTQFGLLSAVTFVPLTYMQMVDGWAYGHGGVSGSYGADALISGGSCVLLALLLWAARSIIPPIPKAAAEPV